MSTIEDIGMAQHLEMHRKVLEEERLKALEAERRQRHHEIVKLAFEHALKSDMKMSAADLGQWCHLMADGIYPVCQHEWVFKSRIGDTDLFDCAKCTTTRTVSVPPRPGE